jgi:phosphoglycerate-specific signal transduction histidine kinase
LETRAAFSHLRMASPTIIEQILEHPDAEEIISKLMSGIQPEDIHDALHLKYPRPEEKAFVFTEKQLEHFKDKHLDVYKIYKRHFSQVKALEDGKAETKDLDALVQQNPAYLKKMKEVVNYKIDVKQMICKFLIRLETRIDQLFDVIDQDPFKWKPDRTVIEWMGKLKEYMELYYKYVEEAPDQVIQHNISIETVDKHSQIILEGIRETIGEFDPAVALMFAEKLSNKLAKLKPENEIVDYDRSATIKELQQDREEIAAKLLE